MKKFISAVVAFAIITASNITYALPQHSPWANESLVTADNAGMLQGMTAVMDFTKPIPRAHVAELVVRAYENVTGESVSDAPVHFTDTVSEYPQLAYQLGLMNGTDDTAFSPDAFTTREAMAKILLTLYARVDGQEPLLSTTPTSHFKDFNEVSDWAKPYVSEGDNMGLLNGFEDITYRPQTEVSYEQAVAFITRAVELRDIGGAAEWATQAPVLGEITRELDITGYVAPVQEFGNVRLVWGASPTTVTVTMDRLSYYDDDIAPRTETYSGTGYVELRLNTNCEYTITVAGIKTVTFKTGKGENVGGADIKAAYPTDKASADAVQVDITVPVWRMRSDGTKYEGSMGVTVHQGIAERVRLVFEEIFAGAEKFPIANMGGYAWRGDGGEHNGGTAIDINWDENYCLYNTGTTIGKCWAPYENVYSITPYGDVVYAFEKYGFTWGGDAWRNPRDYMHFSYLGR